MGQLAPSLDDFFANLPGDWRGDRIMYIRQLVLTVFPQLKESFKWGVPVYSAKKLVLAMSTFEDHVKINFFEGASLPDPHGLFNSGLDSKKHRGINLDKQYVLNDDHLQELISAALAYDAS